MWRSARRRDELLIYDERYNIPLHLLTPVGGNRVAWAQCRPILLHYHWLGQREYRDTLVTALRHFNVPDAWRGWLLQRLDLWPVA